MTREEAIERLKQNKAAAKFYAGMAQNTNAIENELKDIEAIDMAIEALSDRPTGEWVECSVTVNGEDVEIDEWQEAKCSACGKWHTTPYMYCFDNFKYCPNCGERMKGGEDE